MKILEERQTQQNIDTSETKINVMLVLDSLMIGGMHRQMLFLAKHLDRRKYNVVVLTQNTNQGGLRQQFIESGCTLVDLERNSTPQRKRAFNLNIAVRLARELRKHKTDVVLLTSAPSLIYFLFAKRLLTKRVALIGSFRAMTFWKGHLGVRYKYLDDIFSTLLYRTAHTTIVNTQALAKHYSVVVGAKYSKPIVVIENGNDFAFAITLDREATRRQLGLKPDNIAVIMAARLDPWKDFETLLGAAKLTAARNGSIKYILMGDGELRSDIEKRITELELRETVQLIGERKESSSYINACDIAVLSTHGEGFSNAILESMYLQKPVIATDVGGNSDVIGATGECGFLVPRQSPQEMAERIIFLSQNEKIRITTGNRARSRITNLCKIETFIERYDKVLSKAFQDVCRKNC